MSACPRDLFRDFIAGDCFVRVSPGLGYDSEVANNIKTVVLLGLLGGLFVALGWLLGGQTGALLALGFAALFNFAMYFYSDKLALAAARAKPI